MARAFWINQLLYILMPAQPCYAGNVVTLHLTIEHALSVAECGCAEKLTSLVVASTCQIDVESILPSIIYMPLHPDADIPPSRMGRHAPVAASRDLLALL